MLSAEKNKFIALFIIIFGTLSFPIASGEQIPPLFRLRLGLGLGFRSG